nr:hypothetical protein Itr_chr12CG29010 [Ipomoea trifida]
MFFFFGGVAISRLVGNVTFSQPSIPPFLFSCTPSFRSITIVIIAIVVEVLPGFEMVIIQIRIARLHITIIFVLITVLNH